jgi:hypothetical protein
MSPAGDPFVAKLPSLILRLQLKIQGGKSIAAAKLELFAELEAQGRTDLADSFLAYEAVLIERPKVSDKPNVNIYGGTFGNVNFGKQIGTITASANAVAEANPEKGAAFADAIRTLTQSVTESDDLKDEQKKEALDAIEAIGSQAELSPEKRKPGIFKSALSYLPTILSATASTVKIWDLFGPTIKSFFGL